MQYSTSTPSMSWHLSVFATAVTGECVVNQSRLANPVCSPECSSKLYHSPEHGEKIGESRQTIGEVGGG